MMVLLGFAVASLLALVLGRAAWKIAYRLGARRTRKQIPGSMMEMQAERDQLRAEIAMVKRRAAVETEAVRARNIEQTAEVMRNRNRIGRLAEELDSRGRILAQRDAELAALREQLAVVEAELARRTEAIAALEARLAGLEDRATAAGPAAIAPPPPLPPAESVLRLESFRPQPGAELEPDMATAQDRLSRRIQELSRLSAPVERPVPGLPEVRPSPLLPEPIRLAAREPGGAPGNGHDPLTPDRPVPPATLPVSGEASPQPARPVSPSVANVISLAQRLRVLRKDVGG
jgi:hypothetical protein